MFVRRNWSVLADDFQTLVRTSRLCFQRSCPNRKGSPTLPYKAVREGDSHSSKNRLSGPPAQEVPQFQSSLQDSLTLTPHPASKLAGYFQSVSTRPAYLKAARSLPRVTYTC